MRVRAFWGWVLPLAAVLPVLAEDPALAAERIRERMEASLERQRQAIESRFESGEGNSVRQRMQPGLDAQMQSARRFEAPPPIEPAETVELPEAPEAPDSFYRHAWLAGPGGQPWTTVAPSWGCAPLPPEQVEEWVGEASRREGLAPDLLLAVIRRESGFDPCAVSSKGAMGLMQLMPETAGELGVYDPFDPRENIGGGARYLRRLLNLNAGNLGLALASYNAGPGAVRQAGGIPNFPETVSYVGAILRQLGLKPAAAKIGAPGREE